MVLYESEHQALHHFVVYWHQTRFRDLISQVMLHLNGPFLNGHACRHVLRPVNFSRRFSPDLFRRAPEQIGVGLSQVYLLRIVAVRLKINLARGNISFISRKRNRILSASFQKKIPHCVPESRVNAINDYDVEHVLLCKSMIASLLVGLLFCPPFFGNGST